MMSTALQLGIFLLVLAGGLYAAQGNASSWAASKLVSVNEAALLHNAMKLSRRQSTGSIPSILQQSATDAALQATEVCSDCFSSCPIVA